MTEKKGDFEYYFWSEFEDDILRIAEIIRKIGLKYKNIYGPKRGGLVPAVCLSHKLDDLPVITDEKEITEDTLIVDDIADYGKTLQKFVGKNFIITLFFHQHCSFVPCVWMREKTEKFIHFPWEK